MDAQKLNIYILADNALVVNGLRHALESRFRQRVNVTGFYDSRSCLKKVDANTHLAVLDYFLEGKSSLATSKCISAVNPKTRVIMHSSKEDVLNSVGSLLNGVVIYAPQLKFSQKSANQYR
jgi:DNA-binding NarL/FixJ family response regulator